MNYNIILRMVLILLLNINMLSGEITSGYEILNLETGGDVTAASSISLNKGVNSFYYNPALLSSQIKHKGKINTGKNNIYMGYNRLAGDINYISVFSSFIDYIGEIGIGVTGLLLDNSLQTSYNGNEYNIEEKGVTLGGYVFILGQGIQITEKINAGLNLTAGSYNIEGDNNLGIGITAGITYKNKDWGIGLTINNIGGSIANYTEDRYPYGAGVGGHYIFYLFKSRYGKIHKLRITDKINYEIINNSIINIIGAEYIFNEIMYIRSSIEYDSEKNYKIGTGVGVLYKGKIKGDYGIIYSSLGITHSLGVGIIWNQRWLEKENDNIKLNIKKFDGEKYIYLKADEIFKDNSSDLSISGQKKLKKLISKLKENKKIINIFGYSSKDGGSLINSRIKKIVEYFVAKGIEKNRIDLNGKYSRNNKIKKYKDDGITIVIKRLSREEQEEYDYYYFMGMDNNIKGMKEKALKNWEKALSIDPENKELKKEIQKLKEKIK